MLDVYPELITWILSSHLFIYSIYLFKGIINLHHLAQNKAKIKILPNYKVIIITPHQLFFSQWGDEAINIVDDAVINAGEVIPKKASILSDNDDTIYVIVLTYSTNNALVIKQKRRRITINKKNDIYNKYGGDRNRNTGCQDVKN